ncbi:MAG: magnesium transporter CorA family protein [bacterium]|nr:magnesium transporter CorA family protein [bacterium]
MIAFYTACEQGIVPVAELPAASWINLTNPTYEELHTVSQSLSLSLELLSDALDIDERARCEAGDNYFMIIIRIPVHDTAGPHVMFYTVPLGIVITPTLVITVCRRESDVLDSFIHNKIRGANPAHCRRFVLQIFLRTALVYLRDLKEINTNASLVQEKLHRSMVNKHLLGLLALEKSLVFFTTSLRSNELMIERLRKTPFFSLDPQEQDLFEDVAVENRQAIEMANIYNNILAGMMDAFASIINNNVNAVLKLLTSITIIVAWPTLIFSMYGMNVKLPFQEPQESYLGFSIVMIFSIVSTIALVYVFIKRRWF